MPGDLPTNCFPGAWVSKRMYQSHLKDDAARRQFDDLDDLGKAISALTMQSGSGHQVNDIGRLVNELSDHHELSPDIPPTTTVAPLDADDNALEIYQSLKDLQDLQTHLRQLCLTFSPPRHLDFCQVPKTSGDYTTPSDFTRVNGGTHALKPSATNRPFLEHENMLNTLQLQIDQVEAYGDQQIRDLRKHLTDRIGTELERLDQFKEAEWVKQQEDDARGTDDGVQVTGMQSILITTSQLFMLILHFQINISCAHT